MTATLIALMCCALWWNTSTLMGQPPTAPKAQSRDTGREFKDTIQFTETIEEKMFPDGLTHDFGKVQRGTQVYHAFRIVNTSDVPLRILSVRLS